MDSIVLKNGMVIHKIILKLFRGKKDSEIRKTLRKLFCTKGEQNAIISKIHELNK